MQDYISHLIPAPSQSLSSSCILQYTNTNIDQNVNLLHSIKKNKKIFFLFIIFISIVFK